MSTENVQGMRAFDAKLGNWAARMPQAAANALYAEWSIELKEVKRRCPVSPTGGPLRASIFLDRPVISGREISVTMGCGGPSIPYAIAVHEHLSEHSPPSWQHLGADDIDWNVPGTGPKFMEGPILESTPHMSERIGKRLDIPGMVR